MKLNLTTAQIVNLILAVFLVISLALTVYLVITIRSIQSEAKGPPDRLTGTLIITPDPTPAYTQPTVTGSGFKAGETLYVGIPGDLPYTSVTTNSSGDFSLVYTHRDLQPWPEYTMEALGKNKGKKWRSWVLKASTTFAVE